MTVILNDLCKEYKKAVIIGAAGFIGVNLASYLAAEGYEVVCFDRNKSAQWPDGVRPVLGDFFKVPKELLDELNDALVFHLVSSFRPLPGTSQAADEVRFDLAATLQYLEETKGGNVRWVFLSSGGTVYGQAESEFISESTPVDPICTYGLVKATIENYFKLYHRLHGTDYVVVRLANPYGPWQNPLKPQGVIASIIYKALQNEPLDIWGDGTNVRDYIYIDDAVKAILSIGRLGFGGEVYNVASGRGHSINELVELVEVALGSSLVVNYDSARKVDVRINVLDVSKFVSCTGAEPVVTPINVGIEKTIDWMRFCYLQLNN